MPYYQVIFNFLKHIYGNNVNTKPQSKPMKNKDSYIMWSENMELLTSYLTHFLK